MPFKDDVSKLAKVQVQQISQKLIFSSQHIAIMSLYCEVIPSFVIFAVFV